MRAFARALDLKNDSDLIRRYDEHHARVWPQVVAGLRAIGITRMRLFRHGTRLFMYFEAGDDFDPDRDFHRYAADPRCREWEELMRRFQQPVPGAPEGSWWTPMRLLFDLEATP